eukprot:SAG31_NODE_15_length_37942_cov_32.078297_8_plen_125_part_00
MHQENLKGNSALCVAGTAEVARSLLEAGADPTKINHVSGQAKNPTAVQHAYIKSQQRKGAPPRGAATAMQNWQPTLRRKLVRRMACCNTVNVALVQISKTVVWPCMAHPMAIRIEEGRPLQSAE